jgi:hypothetical protein
MALKAYSFTRTNKYGATVTNYVTFARQSCDWKAKTFQIFFEVFASQEEATRKIILVANGAPTPIASSYFSLILTENEFLAVAMAQIPENERELPFLLIFSNRIWGIAQTAPFIPDFSTINEDGNRVEVLKSLTDLNAELHEIELN